MVRKDGNYEIYIIKFRGLKSDDRIWNYAGDCDQFLPANLSHKEWKKIIYNKPFNQFHACGQCWQETGIFGSYDLQDAMDIMTRVSQWNSKYEFQVCKLEIEQKTTVVASMRMAAVA